MPERILQRYQEALQDPELLALRKEIALTDARLDDLLARVDSGEAGAVWRALHNAYNVFVAANATGDVEGAAQAMNEIGRLLGRGQSDYAAWDEIRKWQEHRAILAEREVKRLVAMRQMVTAEQLAAFLKALEVILKRVVKDPDELRQLAYEIRSLGSRPGAVGALTTGNSQQSDHRGE